VRNALRSALVSFALWSRVIFFSLGVHHLVELLGHMEPIGHSAAVLQPRGARRGIGRAHVHSVGPDLLALLLREEIQTLLGCGRVLAFGHGQDLGPRRIAQVGHQGHVESMPLLQAQFVQTDVGDDPLGIDLTLLGQLIGHDPFHRLGRNPQATSNVLRRAPDQGPEHKLLEAVGVDDVFALERGDNVLAVVAASTAMEGRLVNPKAWLVPDRKVPNGLRSSFELDLGALLVPTFFTPAPLGQGPTHLETMAILKPVVADDLHSRRKVNVDGHTRHGSSLVELIARCCGQPQCLDAASEGFLIA
jgi:hypothetical protein